MKKSFLKILILIGIIAAGIIAGRFLNIDIEKVRIFFGQFPLALSGILFVILYVGSTTFILFGPKDVLRVSSALIFGPIASTVFVWAGEICNAVVLFSISRGLGREYVENKFKLKRKSIDGLQSEGMHALGIFALRINPLVPFRLMDLSFGLSKVDLRKYIAVCLIGSVPRIFWLQYIIHGAGEGFLKEPSALQQYLLDNKVVLFYSLIYFAVIAGVSLLAFIRSMWLKKKIKST